MVELVHGYRYAPYDPLDNPHEQILSLEPVLEGARVLSWPRHLRLSHAPAALGIGFRREARGSVWRAYAEAAQAGRALARLIEAVRLLRPDARAWR